MKHQDNHHEISHYVVMFCIMILSGFLTTMNMWCSTWDDIRFSLNDVYMTLLMTGWMFVFMGIYYRTWSVFLFGSSLTIFIFWCIRTQFMITQEQYLLGMIPHHSMAVHMSNKLLEKKNNIRQFLENVVVKQNEEIIYMKHKLLF